MDRKISAKQDWRSFSLTRSSFRANNKCLNWLSASLAPLRTTGNWQDIDNSCISKVTFRVGLLSIKSSRIERFRRTWYLSRSWKGEKVRSKKNCEASRWTIGTATSDCNFGWGRQHDDRCSGRSPSHHWSSCCYNKVLYHLQLYLENNRSTCFEMC